MYDISRFTLKDMTECSSALRSMGSEAGSMEVVGDRIVHYLYDHLVDQETGDRALALVRLFRTHPYGELGEDLREFARGMLDMSSASPTMKCLVLLATAGMKPEWHSRRQSTGHKALPLPSERFIEKVPMIRQLVQQLGLNVNTILEPDPSVLMDLVQTTYGVFHVPEAVASQHVPAQDEFVIPFGVRSVVGFGGLLPSGNLFAVIMFSRASIPRQTADMFRTLALSVKIAVLPFDGGTILS